MPDYRRFYLPGGTFFFTVVTAARRPILTQPIAIDALRRAMRQECCTRPLTIVAAVVLPDHLHMIWRLPSGDTDYSTRWSAIKAAFTRTWLASGGAEVPVSAAKDRQRYRGVWQPRFIEHTCRDEDDLAEHINYIHYNPVKHGYVRRPIDWPYSSIHGFIRRGTLRADWGATGDVDPAAGLDETLLE